MCKKYELMSHLFKSINFSMPSLYWGRSSSPSPPYYFKLIFFLLLFFPEGGWNWDKKVPTGIKNNFVTFYPLYFIKLSVFRTQISYIRVYIRTTFERTFSYKKEIFWGGMGVHMCKNPPKLILNLLYWNTVKKKSVLLAV